MEIKFEKMKANDLEEIMKIEQASFPLPWTRGMFEQELVIGSSHFFIVRTMPSKEIIGYGGFWQVLEELHLVNLAVKKESRQEGLGRKLLHYLLCQGKALGLRRATLEVRASNTAAQQLYERVGFKNIATRKGYYADNREDAVIMWLYNLAQIS